MAETVLMPKLGLTMTEGVVDEWYKKEGDAVQAGEAVCSISSEKLTQDVEAEQDGILLKIVVQAGESTPVKTPIGYIGQAGESVGEGDAVATPTAELTQPAASAPVAAAPSQPIAKSGARVFISKLARKMASAQGIDYTNITGTGGNGRITKRDVEKYMASGAVVAAAPAEAPTDVSPIQAAATVGAGLNGMRKAIAKNMMYSLHNTAQLTLHRKADITALLAFRAEMKSKVGDGVEAATFSLNILLLKAVALALQACPKLNSRYDGVTLSQPDDINIGVAVALENGLVVPTVADVGRKSLSQLQKDFYGQVARARDGEVDTSSAGTFTITNLGAQGIEYFTPIVNVPEVAILGVGLTTERLTLDGAGELLLRQELPLSLTFDHQIVDGADGAKFLAELAAILAQPYRIIL